MTNDGPTIHVAAHKPPPLKTLAVLFGVIVMVAGYITLCGFLGTPEFYTGFLFLLGWTAFDQGKLETLPRSILGGALGLALGHAMYVLIGGPLGATGGYVFGAGVFAIVYCQLMGWGKLLVNFTTMTFLAVVTIPHIQKHWDLKNAVIAFVAGVIYFGIIIGIAGRLAAKPIAGGSPNT